MADARPVAFLLRTQVFGLGALAVWWWLQGEHGRLGRLLLIALAEEATLSPPSAFLAQAEWLWQHRLFRLQGLSGWLGLAWVIGMGEGLHWRQGDPFRGYRLRLWTLGVLGQGLVPGLVGAYVLAPWPLTSLWVPGGLALVVGCTGFLLAHGRPSVP